MLNLRPYCALALMVFSAASARADSYTALATDDSSIYSGDINHNYCGDSALVIGESSGEWRSVVKWDIVGPDKVPAGSIVNSVSIQFYRQCTSSTGPIFLRFLQNYSGWNECSVNWAIRPTSSTLLGDFPVSPCSGGPQWIQFNDSGNALRDWVQEIVDGEEDNDGLTLRASPLTTGSFQIFRSHRDTPARLIIEYAPKPDNPDMAVTSVDAENGPIPTCSSIDVEVRVHNDGDVTIDSYRVEVRASTNSSWGGDIFLGSDEPPSLSAGQSRTHNFNFNVACGFPPNDYYILARVFADDDVDPSDDIGFDPTRVTVEHPANLAVQTVTFSGSTFEPGQTIPVAFTIENTGGIASHATSYLMVLSQDSVWGNDASSHGPYSVPVIDGGDNWSTDRTIAIPEEIPDGFYYIGVRVDDDGGSEDTRFSQSRVEIAAAAPCDDADYVEPFGTHDFFDVQRFLQLYSTGDPAADLVPDGEFDFFDLQAFLVEFADGCP